MSTRQTRDGSFRLRCAARMVAAAHHCAAATRGLVPQGHVPAHAISEWIDRARDGLRGERRAGPVAATLATTPVTPLHLLGLDMFNRPDRTLVQRAALIRREYLPSTSIRMLRMAPPYSIGTIGLRKLRTQLHRKLGVGDLS